MKQTLFFKYPVSVATLAEGGPNFADMRRDAADMGIKITSANSPYVGQRVIALTQGTKAQFKKLLRKFGCDYI